ncbi:protein translocase subunit SecF [Patescibacteria group bacterium]|nr:protein translocase subunit SecF [Patescibacteria group bacterium]
MIQFTKHRKIYFIFSGALIIASIFALVVFGLKPGIDFTGGSILEIDYQETRPSNQEILEKLNEFDLGTIYVQPTGEKGVILRMKEIDEEIHQQILERLQDERELEEIRFESIGPTIGQELKQKTKIVIVVALLSMIVYIALAFRKVQRPLRSWQYGIASVVALFHDILIPLGIFAVLGKFYSIEISIPVITALLAVLGYSINNTVVVFDRIRENLLKRGEAFKETVDISLNQTLSRQINTSLTTLFVAGAVFFLGGETLKYFALALIFGILAGTYSSIFLAGPILVAWYSLRDSQALWRHRRE